MSCPNRCSNDFKVKNFPDEIECVVAQKISGNDVITIADPSSIEVISFGGADASSNIPNEITAGSFTTEVRTFDDLPAFPGQLLRLTGDNTLVVAYPEVI